MIFLKEITGHNRKVITKWCEQFKKDCSDGYISSQDFEYACEFFFPYINAKAFCSYIFTTFDTDHKGIISLKELMLVVGNMELDSRMAGTTNEDKLKWAIIAHDMWIVMDRLCKICNVK